MPKEASHSRTNGRVPGSVRLGIFSQREHRCRSGLHRPVCGGSTPPSRCVRVANFDSEVPALNRRELGANPRRPTILPMWLSSDSSSFVNCRALPHESASLSIGPISASVVKLQSSSASNGEFAGGSPAGCTNSCRVSPTTRGAPLRPERLGVELPHAAPVFACGYSLAGHFAHVAQGRGSALKTRRVSVQLRPWAHFRK